MTIAFEEFPKIPRYKREVCVTEKIDGTNAAVRWEPAIFEEGNDSNIIATRELIDQHGANLGPYFLFAQSRSRFIKPGADNYGFAQWVNANVDELVKLGPGTHYGEWWGAGIQRRYGLTEKRFSLFNVHRWGEGKQAPPACCHVVPLLAYCKPEEINFWLAHLRQTGSVAAPGFMNPEGVVIWHSQSKQYYKMTIERDDEWKGKQEVAPPPLQPEEV